MILGVGCGFSFKGNEFKYSDMEYELLLKFFIRDDRFIGGRICLIIY